jgi:ribosomal protein S18 acetylase RimI-like enzyme
MKSTTVSIRNLTDTDLEAADEILKLAFQNPISRLDDLWLYRQIQPDGWFIASQDGHPVGMVGATNYGTLAHVGLMAVHPSAQRQGIGLTLMQHILNRLEQQGVTKVMLDASKAGRPLYEKLGFVPYDETLMFERQDNFTGSAQMSNTQPISIRELDELVEWDTSVFGANRRKAFQALFDAFPRRAFAQRDASGRLTGYLFAQKKRIGPWAVAQSCSAEDLLQAALALPYEGTISAAVPSVNGVAIELLQRYGFRQVRSNRHMGKGTDECPGQRQEVYAQASLALG